MGMGKGSYSSEDLPAWLEVGNYSSIAQGVILLDFNQNHLCHYNKDCVYTTNWDQPQGKHNTKIGHDVWVGSNALILPGITINDGAIIGAGAVVSKDVPSYAVVIGNPATISRFRFSEDQIKSLKAMQWWYWDEDKVSKAREAMYNIDEFLKQYV